MDSGEDSEEENSSSANDVQPKSLQSFKEENSDDTKSIPTLVDKSKDLAVTKVPDKDQTSPKKDEVSKISTSSSLLYVSLPPIELPPPPINLPMQQQPSYTSPVTLLPPVSKGSTSPSNQKLENAIRDPRIARRNALTLPSGKILPIKEKNGPSIR